VGRTPGRRETRSGCVSALQSSKWQDQGQYSNTSTVLDDVHVYEASHVAVPFARIADEVQLVMHPPVITQARRTKDKFRSKGLHVTKHVYMYMHRNQAARAKTNTDFRDYDMAIKEPRMCLLSFAHPGVRTHTHHPTKHENRRLARQGRPRRK